MPRGTPANDPPDPNAKRRPRIIPEPRIGMGPSAQERHAQRDDTAEALFGKLFWRHPTPVGFSRLRDGRFFAVNESFLKLIGFEREEVVGNTSVGLGMYRDADDGEKIAELLRKHGTVHAHETRIRTKDGDERTIQVSAETLTIDGEPYVGFVLTDVTETKRTETDLRGANDRLSQAIDEIERRTLQLEDANRELETFADTVSHDLQSPLRSIRNFVELLKQESEGRLTPDLESYVATIVESADRMRDLVRQTLDYARAGRVVGELVPTRLDALMDDVRRDLDASIRDAQVELVIDPLPTVVGDAAQLRRLFENLIANAIKFHGERPPRVRVSAKADGDWWRFSVRDNGIGIPTDFLERIFQPFVRGPQANRYAGFGLGLSICQRVVHGHGGTIWAESEPGQGSRFVFTLPRHALVRLPARE